MTELKPCNECGGSPYPVPQCAEWRYGAKWQCICRDCGASTGRKKTPAEAIAAWNTRHQARTEVVGEIVAWLRDEARGPYFADLIEAKFGADNGQRHEN